MSGPDRNQRAARPACSAEILGARFEHSLTDRERHAAGVHFTSPADIMKVVGPTIVAPWSQRIERASTPEALLGLHAEMQRYEVLDPACGTGVFLYVAYRELKRLEARLVTRISQPTGVVTIAQFYGIDKDPRAVALAKRTMMMGRESAIAELGRSEPPVAIEALDRNFQAIDALVDAEGRIPPWPPVNVIVGNPPFLDARKLTIEHGRAYVERLRNAYPDIPGRADYCVYWFRRAHDESRPWTSEELVSGRVGLVGTKTIRQNYSREGGLDHVVAHGGTIVDAVATQVWPGSAAVHVAIVNWVKGRHDGPKLLQEQVDDRRDSGWTREIVDSITSALTSQTDVSSANDLRVVTAHKRCFEGQQPGHKGFRIDRSTRQQLARNDSRLDTIVFEYMNGNSLLTERHRTRPEFVIDFGDSTLVEAGEHPDALALVRASVLPDWRANADTRDAGEHQRRLAVWWRLKRRRAEMLAAIAPLARYMACVRHTKHPIFVFLNSAIHPDSALTVFGFEDDYSFGILQSDVHGLWFKARCSSLARRFRYTSETVFDSFPWPQAATIEDIDRVATHARRLRSIRADALAGTRGGLRALYKRLEADEHEHPLRAAQRQLNAAVLQAYGFDGTLDILAQILALNRRVNEAPNPVGPGAPLHHPNPRDLVSSDCILPYHE